MPIDIAKLDELKRLLATSKQLSVIVEYFFDHFAEDAEFVGAGVRLLPGDETLQMIETVVGQAAGILLKKPGITPTRTMLIEATGLGFFHGTCVVANRMISILYFDDIKTGALAFAFMPGVPGDGIVHYSRFTTTPLTKPISPLTAMHPAPKKRTIH